MNRTQWILLAAVFGLYLLFGAVVIMHLEAPAEEANLDELHDLRNVIYDELIASDAVNQTEREEIWIRIAEMINQPTLIRNGSLPNKKWSVYNSFFVAVTAVTTIGYGHLSPSTVSGKVFCIFFSLVGIPLNGILFVTLGDYFGAKIAEKKDKQMRSGQRGSTGWIAALMYLLYYFIPGTIIFVAVPAGLFTYMEDWTYMDSFYYAFISLTTIGFGDLVAGHQGIAVYGHWAWLYRSFIIIWIFFGLAYFVMVISIITKVIRSAPVAVLEKKVSERLRRATRISLAKDGLLLRQLINQIQLTKIQPVYKSRKGHRTESQPAFFPDGETCKSPSLTLHQQDRIPNTLKGCLSDTALGFIDVEATFHNKHRPFSKDDAVDSSGITDPMELLSRLADALCNDESDEEEDMIIMKKLGALSADASRSQYLSRSSLGRASLPVVEESRPASNKLSDMNINPKPKEVLHEQVASRRSFRHPRSRRLSETRNPNISHNPFNYSTYRDSVRNQCHLAFDEENKEVQSSRPRRMFNRSVSESNAPPRQVRFDWPSLNNNNTGANNSISENPINEEKSTDKASVAEFCDLLDRVQISQQQNNVSSQEQ